MDYVKIIIVDDHPIFREGLRALLEKQENVLVVAEADDGRHVLQLARDHNPDIIIMDITLPGLNGIEATRNILREMSGIKIIALSIHTNHIFVEEMVAAGAVGYVLKSSAFEDLVQAIHAVMQDNTYFSPKVLMDIEARKRRQYSDQNPLEPSLLSTREREVLQLIAEGKSSKEITQALNVSLKTVEKHRHCIKDKLKIYSTAELTKYAIRAALTSIDL